MAKAIADDVSRISRVAALLQVSEFEVFCRAHINWYGDIGDEAVLSAAFQQYLNHSIVPLWVRDFSRKALQQDLIASTGTQAQDALDKHQHTAPLTPQNRLLSVLLGLFILLGLAAVVAGIIRLAILTHQTSALHCTLPPCY